MAVEMGGLSLFTVFFLTLFDWSLALDCGLEICIGQGAYCCGELCCFHQNNRVWDFWWFWMLWVFIFLFMVSCGFCCHRRRRFRNPDYIVVQGARSVYGQPVYGTIGNNDATPIVYGAGQVGAVMNGQTTGQYRQASGALPAYSPAVKPPEYSTVAQDNQTT